MIIADCTILTLKVKEFDTSTASAKSVLSEHVWRRIRAL